jgi:hypothetical protein
MIPIRIVYLPPAHSLEDFCVHHIREAVETGSKSIKLQVNIQLIEKGLGTGLGRV